MITAIYKRDGRQAPFNLEKISNAILKSLMASGVGGSEQALALAARVVAIAEERKFAREHPSVEEIQDIVERVLIDADLADAAKGYILYRAERTRVREMNTRLMKTFDEITVRPSSESDLKRDNANIDGDTAMGAMLKYGSEGVKIFNEMYILKLEHALAHKNGDIHIHDFDFYTLTTTCCQIDALKLFRGGFTTGHGFLREPNGIASYAALACIAIQSNQNDQHGGQSIPNFDYAMAEGVRKTYSKSYKRNLAKALELCGGDDKQSIERRETFARKHAEARTLGLKVIGAMRQYVDGLVEEHKLNFSLIATPAEGLAGRFVRIDCKRFGNVKDVTDRDYYTNSFHIPVYYPISAAEKIAIEAPYHELTNGGHITYVELDGDVSQNLDAFESVVRCMKERGVGYGAINHPVDRDPVCHYTGVIGDICPKCGRREEDGVKFERIRRITGYLVGTLDRFNDAKRAEEKGRVKHNTVEYEREIEII